MSEANQANEANKEVVRRYQQAMNDRHWDALDDVVAADVAMPLAMPGFPPGLEGAKALGQATLDPWPDFRTEIDQLIAEGDRVVAVVTMTGTAVNPGFGLPGTGKPFVMRGAYVVRIADGKIVEHSGVEDALSLVAQITS